MKHCSKCGETKLRSEFYKQKKSADGLQGYCKPCSKSIAIAHGRTEEGKQYHIEYSKNKVDSKYLLSRKYRQVFDGLFAVLRVLYPTVSPPSLKSKQRQRLRQERLRVEAAQKGYCLVCHKEPATHGVECEKCKTSKANRRLKKNFGITLDDYLMMFDIQQGRCAICGIVGLRAHGKGSKLGGIYLVVDHCHQTGRVRKLLCHRCNTMIGLAKESLNTLRSAIDYLSASTPI